MNLIKVIISIILFLGIIHLYNLYKFRIYNYIRKYKLKETWNFINSMNYKIISKRSDIPFNLRNKILIIKNNVKYDPKNKITFIKDIFKSIKYSNSQFKIDNTYIVDFLDYKDKYYFGPHTDIEWNAIENPGFQVWSLIKNKHNRGNIFIIYNPYLYKKYKNIGYYLKKKKNNIIVEKNCKFSEIISYGLETIPIDKFIKETELYYINIPPGYSLLFDKDICHISDQINNENRYAINFRVIYNKIKFKKNNFGYVNNKNQIFKL